MHLPALSDTDLVATVKRRATAVVDYRMDPMHGNNPSVLTNQPVPVTLSTSEIDGRSDEDLKVLLRKAVGSKVEARGFAFTITAITPGDMSRGSVNVQFAEASTR